MALPCTPFCAQLFLVKAPKGFLSSRKKWPIGLPFSSGKNNCKKITQHYQWPKMTIQGYLVHTHKNHLLLIGTYMYCIGEVTYSQEPPRAGDKYPVRLLDCQTVRLTEILDCQTIRLSDCQTVRLSDCQTVRL